MALRLQGQTAVLGHAMERVFVVTKMEQLAQLAYEVYRVHQGDTRAWKTLSTCEQREWMACLSLVLETYYPHHAAQLRKGND